MRKDFADTYSFKLTMEEKQRLNTIYGTGITHCDGLSVTHSFGASAEDIPKCEYESVLKTGIYPLEEIVKNMEESRLTDKEEN